ncbi:MAG: class II fructose-bisphosphate aldolase [Spirochaetia bacterium]
MALVSMSTLLRHALEHGYAVGYFESWNLESLLAVKDAAEQAGSPVIIGFNGGFLGKRDRRVSENIHVYGGLGRAVAEQAAVPMSFILNEAAEPSLLMEGLAAGFNVVMHDHEGCTLEQSIAINASLVREAHAAGAEVEAEMGELPAGRSDAPVVSEGRKTDPQEAAQFVRETGVDALAVAVGNVHVLEGRKSHLDFPLLSMLRAAIQVPLVLHGGTGLDENELREAIKQGICKINVGTVLRRTYINALKAYFAEHDVDGLDPGEVTSTGGKLDMLARARAEVAAEIVRLMQIFGSAGKARLR